MPRFCCCFSPCRPPAVRDCQHIARPENYRLWFAPDLEKETFRGRATIRVQLTEATSVITLHAAEIAFDKVRITSAGVAQDATVTLHPESETASLTVPQPLAAGPAEIDITYTGILNDKLRGFYLSQANGRKYAVSQMEATDARRAFPSFDEPAFKATFDISADDRRARYCDLERRADLGYAGARAGQAHRRVRDDAKPMSTYLVALLVGDFTCRDSKAGPTPVRVCSTPDKKALTGFALEAAVTGARVLRRLLRHPVSVRQAGHRRRAGLRRRRHGEHRRDHVPRRVPARRSGPRLARDQEDDRRRDVARDRAPVVRRSRHHEVVGRHLAERGLRHLDGEQAARRVAPGVARRARRCASRRSGRWRSTRCNRRGRSGRKSKRRSRSTRSSTRSPTRKSAAVLRMVEGLRRQGGLPPGGRLVPQEVFATRMPRPRTSGRR